MIVYIVIQERLVAGMTISAVLNAYEDVDDALRFKDGCMSADLKSKYSIVPFAVLSKDHGVNLDAVLNING